MKNAIVLFNLGGPDKPESIQRFLFNLFNDPNIIPLPTHLRAPLAWFVSKRRNKEASATYAEIGGGSPILEITNKQAKALQISVQPHLPESRTFVCMRYWHPMTKQVVTEVKGYNPDKVFLLPLYPQYSTTTTKSSLDAWFKEAEKQNLTAPTNYICCYPTQDKLITAHQKLIQSKINQLKNKKVRILFSAHGLPMSTIKKGDPYQWQMEQTVKEILKGLSGQQDHVLCYQSKVTPVKWLRPSTADAVKKATQEGMAIIVVPVAFVSDHSETLVELDIQYKKLAANEGSKDYYRIDSLNTNSTFIKGLSDLVLKGHNCSKGANLAAKICPKTFKACYHNLNG